MADRDAERRSPHGVARTPSRERRALITVLFLITIISVVPWRPNSLYSGGVDVVVIAKALLALAALVGAVALALHTRDRIPVGLGPAGLLAIVLLVSLLGGVVSGNGQSTVVLVVRVFIVMATVLLLISSAPWDVALSCLFSAMAIVAVVAAVTGLPGLAGGGRLGGGIPTIHPNELAALAATPLVALVIRSLQQSWRVWRSLLIVVLLGIVIASGSRIALLGLAVAFVLAAVLNGIRDRSLLYGVLVSIPIVYAVAVFTPVVGDLASRSGSNEFGTSLASRFTAWQVVLGWEWSSWERWIGLGLSVEQVQVNDKYHPEQVLDSSWVSLLAQAGLISVILVAGLVAWMIVAAIVSSERRRLMVPLVALLVVRTGTESGLVDSAMPFVLLVAYTAVLTHRNRHSQEDFERRAVDSPLALHVAG